MTRPWFLRRLVGDARRHAAVWLALAGAFALFGFCAGAARLALADLAATAARAPAPEQPARVVAYLKDDLGERDRSELLGVLAKLPGVDRATLIAPREGLERLRQALGERAALLEGVEPELLFSSIEIAARPASAASIAFRLRRLRGIADVDLVPPADAPAAGAPPAASPAPRAFARARASLASVGPLLSGAGVALLAVGTLLAALAFLRARLRPELGLLITLGVTRATGARPTLVLATCVGGLAGALGVLAASIAARVWLGAVGLPGPELALGVAALLVLALAAAAGAVSGREAVRAA